MKDITSCLIIYVFQYHKIGYSKLSIVALFFMLPINDSIKVAFFIQSPSDEKIDALIWIVVLQNEKIYKRNFCKVRTISDAQYES